MEAPDGRQPMIRMGGSSEKAKRYPGTLRHIRYLRVKLMRELDSVVLTEDLPE
jgi:hypothetical protein